MATTQDPSAGLEQTGTATISLGDLGHVHALFVWFPLLGLNMEFLTLKHVQKIPATV